jgi:hypothetical protein
VTVPKVAWDLDGNDQYGDCVVGTAANTVGVAVAVLEATFGPGTPGTTVPVPSAAQAIAEYKALTGCVTPGDANDTGLVISTFLQDWATAPGLFGGDLIGGYAPVYLTDIAEIKQAVAAYSFVVVGVNLPQSAEDQVENAPAGTIPVWSYVGDQPIGGHCVAFVGYDTTYLYAYTWGTVVAVELAWWQAYGEEVWAVIPMPFVAAGKGPEVDLAELQADIGSLDGPTPTPTPTPPAPTPPKPTPTPPRPKPKRHHRWWWQLIQQMFAARK